MGFCILTNNIDTSLVEQLNTAVSNLNTNKQNKLIDNPTNPDRNFKRINGQSLLDFSVSKDDINFKVNGKSFESDGNVNIDVGVTKIKFDNTDVSPINGAINLVAGTNIKAFDISDNKITLNGSNEAIEFSNGTLLNIILNNPNYNTFFKYDPTTTISDFPKGLEKSEAAIFTVRTPTRITVLWVSYTDSSTIFTRSIFQNEWSTGQGGWNKVIESTRLQRSYSTISSIKPFFSGKVKLTSGSPTGTNPFVGYALCFGKGSDNRESSDVDEKTLILIEQGNSETIYVRSTNSKGEWEGAYSVFKYTTKNYNGAKPFQRKKFSTKTGTDVNHQWRMNIYKSGYTPVSFSIYHGYAGSQHVNAEEYHSSDATTFILGGYGSQSNTIVNAEVLYIRNDLVSTS